MDDKSQAKAIECILEFLRSEFEDDSERYQRTEHKPSFQEGYAAGVESSTLMVYATVLKLISSKVSARDLIQQIMDMIETTHYAGHVLRGAEPRCAAIEELIEETADRITPTETLLAIKKAMQSAASTPVNPNKAN